MAYFVVEGETAPIDCQLVGDLVPYSLVGCTVAITALKMNGTVKTLVGTVSVTDAAAGKVRFSPDAADFVAADNIYRIRFMVTTAGGKIEPFPRGERENWVVQK